MTSYTRSNTESDGSLLPDTGRLLRNHCQLRSHCWKLATAELHLFNSNNNKNNNSFKFKLWMHELFWKISNLCDHDTSTSQTDSNLR